MGCTPTQLSFQEPAGQRMLRQCGPSSYSSPHYSCVMRYLSSVKALHYYFHRTSDLSQNKELVFVSFMKSFNKYISSATHSSRIKETVILCYVTSDQEVLTLHQVKAHDMRTFASRAIWSEASLEQLLSAYDWKLHNTFTKFYLNDVA